ncbi:hypothetical protein Sste5346_009225 [Sporothrix stenoceras]|uniref:3-oxoacyl-acyl carrier protein reductase n=1 Tax=Sporothrix stenoceras TaxID=5173 RepID=A0ABR3YM25_9PEZI
MRISLSIRPRLAAAPWRAHTFTAGFMQSRSYSDDRGINGSIKINENSIANPDMSQKSGDGSAAGAFEPLSRTSAVASRRHWLVDKNAIVTGGSRGIGEAIAIRLAQEGVRCTVVGRDEWALKNVVKRLDYWYEQGLHGGPAPKRSPIRMLDGASPNVHSYVVGDVRDEDLWPGLFKDKNISILVNAAGVQHTAFLSRTDPVDMRRVIGTNVYGTLLASREAMVGWLANRGMDRVIINISSLLAFRGGIGAASYAASKASVVAATRALADEGKSRGIRANVIVPGYIETDMTDRRFGYPAEVADAAMFLINNKYANNCVLNLDGGLSATG